MASKREMAASALVRSGVSSVFGRAVRWSGVLTLNYHRIGDGSRSEFDRGLWSATPEEFAAQVEFLQAHFEVISPDALEAVRKRGRGRFAMITFDDGYRDNYTAAFEILKRRGAPATFFVATGFLDSPSLPWWDEIAWMVRRSPKGSVALPEYFAEAVAFDTLDRERAIRCLLRVYKAMPAEKTGGYLAALAEALGSGRADQGAARELWMTWDMLRSMHAGGMTIGGHTVTHPILSQMTEEQQFAQISGCGVRIATEIGTPLTCFSYPVGSPANFNDATRRSLARAGVKHAFSYYGGVQRFGAWDDYDIRRLPVDHDTTFDSFRAMVTMPQVFGRAELTAAPG